MKAIDLVPTKDMDRKTWLEERRRGIGGSDVAAIAGLNKWKSPIAVWLEKTGQAEPDKAGEAAYWGTELEDVVAREFSRRTGKKVRRRNAILQHPEYPFMLANVDRLVVGEKAGLECKTSSEWRRGEWDAEGKLPPEYLLQIQHYMAVTGFDKWYVAVLIGGNEFIHFEVERDQEIIDYLITIESDFWQMVENETMPAPDGSDATKDLIGKMYPDSNYETVELPSEAEALIAERERWREAENDAKLKRQEAENKLKRLLGENETGFVGDKRVSWKTIITNRLDTKKLQEEQPNIYAQYLKGSSYRRFSIR